MKFLRHLLGITKWDKEKKRCVRETTGAQNIVEEIKQYQKKWLQNVQRTDTNRITKQALQYRPKDERTLDDRRRDGGTNFILRIKEQETRLTFHEHDDDDECAIVYLVDGPVFGRNLLNMSIIASFAENTRIDE